MSTLTLEQFELLTENYAQLIVDGMDLHSLEQFAYETIIDNLQSRNEGDILDEIEIVYDNDIINDLLDVCNVSPEQRAILNEVPVVEVTTD